MSIIIIIEDNKILKGGYGVKMEQWRPVKGYENLYEVSNMGNIRSLNYRRTRKTKILKPIIDRYGYLSVVLCKNSNQQHKSIHRLVADAFIHNPEGKLEVNHIDGDKTNNKASNLEWSTRSENVQHSYDTNLHELLRGENNPMYGKKHPRAKKVICITTGEIFNCIAEAGRKYNVAPETISKCCKDKYKSAGKHPVTKEKLIWKYI